MDGSEADFPITPPSKPEPRATPSSIVLEKIYHDEKGQNDSQPSFNKLVESVINQVINRDEITSLLYNGYEMLPHVKEEPVQLTDDIYFVLTEIERKDDTGKLAKICFSLYSHTLSVNELRTFLYRCEKDYQINVQNKLGEALYFFDHRVMKVQKSAGMGSIGHSKLPFMMFNKHPFQSNRSFDNTFFEQKGEVMHRLEFFMNRKEWYDRKGIPYTLGFLFYGVPGCGKTSTIKAIANKTGRHIININLSEIKTKRQLKNLFYNEELVCMKHTGVQVNSEETEVYRIPISKRLYVIEDIDATTSVASRFKTENWDDLLGVPQGVGAGGRGGAGASMMVEQHDADDEEIDLTTLLNILDGTLETPERMIVITTNYPERLDNALIRPGRIDIFVEFKLASSCIIKQMYENFYEKRMTKTVQGKIPEYVWTPAEVNQLLFQCFGKSKEFINIITESTPEEQFKYSHGAIHKYDRGDTETGDGVVETSEGDGKKQIPGMILDL